MAKCPESMEELEAAERHLHFCRAERAGVYDIAKAKIESGAASGWKDAEKQIAEETGRDVEAIRTARKREQRDREGGPLAPLCETELQAAEWDPDAEDDEDYCCSRCSHYDCDKRVCWLHREDAYGDNTCDSWLGWNDDGEAVITKPGIDADADERICISCWHYDVDRRLCFQHRDDVAQDHTCDDWRTDQISQAEPTCPLPHVAQNTGENEWKKV